MKNKTLILYKSKSGFAEGHAKLIHKNIDSDIVRFKKFDESFLDYETIIYLGGCYIGGINGFKKIKKRVINSNQRVIVVAVGAAPGKVHEIKEIKDSNFIEGEFERFEFHYLRGGFDYAKCTPVDKVLMSFLKWKLKRIKEPTADQVGLLKSYDKPLSFVSEEKTKKFIDELNI